jgi:hypothetical protein
MLIDEIVVSVKSKFIKNIINERLKKQLEILFCKKVIAILKGQVIYKYQNAN